MGRWKWGAQAADRKRAAQSLFNMELEESGIGNPCSVTCRLRLLVVQDLEVACRLALRMQKQQPQELAVNATFCANDDDGIKSI